MQIEIAPALVKGIGFNKGKGSQNRRRELSPIKAGEVSEVALNVALQSWQQSSERGQYVPPKGQIKEAHTLPDYDAISAALGEEAPADRDSETIGRALRRLLLWLTETKDGKPDLTECGARTLSLAHALDPSIIAGSPSLRKLAEQVRLSKSELSRRVVGARAEFKLPSQATTSTK